MSRIVCATCWWSYLKIVNEVILADLAVLLGATLLRDHLSEGAKERNDNARIIGKELQYQRSPTTPAAGSPKNTPDSSRRSQRRAAI